LVGPQVVGGQHLKKPRTGRHHNNAPIQEEPGEGVDSRGPKPLRVEGQGGPRGAGLRIGGSWAKGRQEKKKKKRKQTLRLKEQLGKKNNTPKKRVPVLKSSFLTRGKWRKGRKGGSM